MPLPGSDKRQISARPRQALSRQGIRSNGRPGRLLFLGKTKMFANSYWLTYNFAVVTAVLGRVRQPYNERGPEVIKIRMSAQLCAASVVLALLAGCGGSTPTAPAITVSVSPTTATLIGGASATFTATLTNDTANAGVSWTATTGTITSAGVYTAPAVITATSATVTATSKTDTTKTSTATITLTPISVAITPTAPTAMTGGTTQQFTAVVTADGANAGVTWTASTGTISSTGLYTAPAIITATSATVSATSKTDTTKTSNVVTITLTPISVSVSPATGTTLIGGATQQFTPTVTGDTANAGVTWTASTGTISATGLYTAPAVITGTSATVTATSKTDTTKSATGTITLTPISVGTITPTSGTPSSLVGGGSVTFTVAVNSDGSSSGVTWSIGTGVGTLSSVTTTSVIYTAPAIISGTVPVTITLTATSIKDGTKTNTATITLNPIAVSFTTVTTGITLDSGQNLALSAAITYDSSASGATFAATGAGSAKPASATGNSPATVLTATGTVASTVTVTATSVKDTTKTATTASITVNPALALTTTSGALASGIVGSAYAGATIAAAGGTGTKTFAVASGALPGGFSLSTAGAITSVNPITAALGTFTFAVSVTDAATTPVTVTSGSYTITINPAPLVWTAPTVSPAAFTVGTAITPIALTTTGGTGAVTFAVKSGSLPTGLSITGSAGTGYFISGTPTQPTIVAGNVVTFLATDSAITPVTASSPSLTFVANPVTLAITTTSLNYGTINVAYSSTMNTTGGVGPITWSMNPATVDGISINATTGVLSGLPGSLNSSNVTITATDSAVNQGQTKSVNLALNITNALAITTTTPLPYAISGTAYTTTFHAAGGSGTGYTWSITAGASNLTALNLVLTGSSGVLSGTPSAAGSAIFTVQVTDSASNTASTSFTLNAYAPLTLPSPNPSSLGSATTTQSYTGSISSAGGTSPYTWTVNGSTVPVNGTTVSIGDGLSVSNTGTNTLNVSGTPTTVTTVSFTAKVTDGNSNSVGPNTYSVGVSTTYTVSGQITSPNCGTGLANVKVSLNTTPTALTSTTNSSGQYSISNVPNGTYTLTPTITAGGSIFFPATSSVVVNGSNVIDNFTGEVGYTVSGTVAYSGAQTGPIYVSMVNNNCGGNTTSGTAILTKGAYTIRGVQPGSYTLTAWMDSLGFGAQNITSASGSTAETITTFGPTAANVTLTDPAATTLTTAPQINGVSGFNTGALIQPQAITNNNNVELATSYILQWSTSSTFATITGTKTFKAQGPHGAGIWFLNGLTNGSIYYFRAEGVLGATPSGVFSSIYGPVTIGAPTPAGGVAVSGAISYTGTATGPLYTGFYDQNTGNFYGEYIASPASAQAYTVQVPPGSNYLFVGVIDQNNDGQLDVGDIQNTNNTNNTATVITAATTGENLTLPSYNSTAIESTQHNRVISTTTTDTYGVNVQVNGMLKLPITFSVTSASNPDVLLITDVGLGTGGGSLTFSPNLSTDVPAPGDTYGLVVTYSDGTTDNLTATVGTIPSFFATNLAPSGTGTNTTPTFTWTYPANAANYTYQFNLSGNGGTVWQLSGNNNGNGFSSTVTPSLTWGVDPSGTSGNTPSGPLTGGVTYYWQIQSSDSNGNSATTQVTYVP
jgi:hypothetical protein